MKKRYEGEPRVKICGITNYEDAMVAIEAGADALGFVFYEKSPRYITPEAARKIAKYIPPFVERVGLFVELEPKEVDSICQKACMGIAQIHFEADENYFQALQTKSLPVVRARSREDVVKFSDRYRLIDAYCESYGGAGKRLNLSWFDGVDCSKIIIAGGLSADNVADVLRYGFYGVDVSSGVERSRGVKDPKRVRAFVKAAKEAQNLDKKGSVCGQ
ncbi:phosphoribosylanthranilate isomerase [Hydrogenimonas sp.]